MIQPASQEQLKVIEELNNNYNVIIDSVAGSGKTTCNLHIAKHFKDSNILLLTYNAKLKIETRTKIHKNNLKNIETHSYHSFCVKYYNDECFTDIEIIKLLQNNLSTYQSYNYDIIILDESQDTSPLYFQLVCKIFKDNNNKNTKICILGDKKQSIFDFNNADERFITFADELFTFNNLLWKKCNLSRSFRITSEMSEFINKVMLNEDRIYSLKVSNIKPRYIICNCFGENSGFNKIYDELEYYLNLGYLPKDIFILTPSINTNVCSQIRLLENKIKQKLNIPVFVPIGDDVKLDKDILENKLVFSTFHQSKGLERKVVLVLNFDSSYFTYYKKNINSRECPNELYVATTRAIERLSVFHHYENDYLNFICSDKIQEYCELIIHKRIINKIDDCKNKEDKDIGVCDLIKHLPQEILYNCYKYLEINTIQEAGNKIDIDIKTKQNELYEEVSEITGIAIPSFLEYKLTGDIEIYNKLFDEEDLIINFNKNNSINFQDIKLSNLTPENLLQIANCWNCHKTEFLFKIYQIKNYNWVSQEHINMCIDRLNKFNFTKTAKFECKTNYKHKLLPNKNIVGYIDCIFENNIYEFKCVSKLKMEHYIQLALYKYLYESNNKKSNNNCYLYNILTDELALVKCDYNKLEEMVNFLIYHKYNNIKYMTDELFKLDISNIREKYI